MPGERPSNLSAAGRINLAHRFIDPESLLCRDPKRLNAEAEDSDAVGEQQERPKFT
jgi:hypothetical protein